MGYQMRYYRRTNRIPGEPSPQRPYDPFPQHARGFFYHYRYPTRYHISDAQRVERRVDVPPNPLAAELRFRCVPSGSLDDFDDGQDLLLPDMMTPWSIPLFTLSQGRWERAKKLYELLTTPSERADIDAYVSRSVSRQRSTKPTSMHRPVILPNVLHPFADNLARHDLRFILLDPDIFSAFRCQRRYGFAGYSMEVSGKALCRYELFSEGKASDPAVGYRILRWFQPPDPASQSPQIEGDLLRQLNRDGSLGRPARIQLHKFPPASQELLLKAYPHPQEV